MSSEKIVLRTSDGFDIVGRFSHVADSKRAVIFAHGLSSDKDHNPTMKMAEKQLNEKGISTFALDFRCHGESSGDSIKDFNITGELIDLETVVAFLKENGFTHIGITGSSFGGGTSSLYAGKHIEEIGALCLLNPVLDYTRAFLNPTTEWARRTFADAEERIEKDGYIAIGSREFHAGKPLFDEMKEYVPLDALKKYERPLLFIHGDQDTKVNHEDTYNSFVSLESSNKELEIIHGGDHGFKEEPFTTEVAELITDFFVTRLK